MKNPVSSGRGTLRREICRAMGIGVCAIVLLALAGCSRKGAAHRAQATTQASAAGDAALRQAYEELLVNPVWAPIDIEPKRYVQVSGNLKGGAEPGLRLEVYYEKDVTPARVAFFKVGTKQYAPARFPEFIRWAVLNQELDACVPPAAEPPAAASVPAP